MPIAQKMAQSATSAATAMKTGATSAANAIKTGTSNLSAALMSKGQEALKTLATAFKSLCHSVSSTIQTSGAKVSDAMEKAMPSGAQVSKTIDRGLEAISITSVGTEVGKIIMEASAPGLEHLGEVGHKILEGFETAAPALGTAIGVVSLASGLKEAYKGINAYMRASTLDSTIKSEATTKLTAAADDIKTLPSGKTDKAECDQLLKDLTFSVENNYTRAGDKAKLAAIEIASGTTVLVLHAVTSGISVLGSVGILAGTMAAKSLVTHHRGAQETKSFQQDGKLTTLKEQRADTTERLTKKLGEIQTKITTKIPLSQSDKLMLEGLKSVGLLSKQTDVSGDLSTQSARGKIMTKLRGKQTVSAQLAAIKPNNLIHAFTKGADGIEESHESHSTAHATPHIQTERTAL